MVKRSYVQYKPCGRKARRTCALAVSFPENISISNRPGDDVLSLFILALRASTVKDRLAHIAYVEVYLQGAAGRSGSSEAARFETCSNGVYFKQDV